MCYKTRMNKYLTLSGILIGMVIGSLMLDAPTASWLVISIVVLLPLLAYWQAKQIRTHLPNDKPLQKKGWIKPALLRSFFFSLFVCIGLFIEALWWTQQQTLQKSILSDEKAKIRTLPLSMSLQKGSGLNL